MLNDGTFVNIGGNMNDEDRQPEDQKDEDEDVFRIIETID